MQTDETRPPCAACRMPAPWHLPKCENRPAYLKDFEYPEYPEMEDYPHLGFTTVAAVQERLARVWEDTRQLIDRNAVEMHAAYRESVEDALASQRHGTAKIIGFLAIGWALTILVGSITVLALAWGR